MERLFVNNQHLPHFLKFLTHLDQLKFAMIKVWLLMVPLMRSNTKTYGIVRQKWVYFIRCESIISIDLIVHIETMFVENR